MKQQLSVASRILVAFASGALIAVFFLPAWRIDLFAPQYPEGLTMNIWINGLSGEVDIINGLNHYIGMEPISPKMFPEFKFLPYVVGFFMLLGMVVAITGKKRFLFYYLILTAIGGIAALYDFYRWGYKYGHNLDPSAPIQVPGLSYQPPIFGHKRILNFDAYSFPDVGGWIVIAAGALAFTVFAVEWLKERKQNKRKMKPIVLFLLPLLLAACTPKAERITLGKDSCSFCKMTIMDPKYGAEIVTNKSKVYKFDDVICMTEFLHSGILTDNQISKKLLVDFEKENSFIDIKDASFWVSEELRSPMGSNAAAFSTEENAKRAKGNKEGKIVKWDNLFSGK